MKACIRVRVLNHDKTIMRKTIPIRGAFKLQLLAAGKVLSLLSAFKELEEEASSAVIELDGVEPSSAKQFVNLVKRYAPLPVTVVFVERKEV